MHDAIYQNVSSEKFDHSRDKFGRISAAWGKETGKYLLDIG